MPYVVTENCKGCRFTDCVEVCPVDCFYADAQMLYIHPDDCIDCGACEFACPVQAIFAEENLPGDLVKWIEINAEKVDAPDVVNITVAEDPLPGAEARKAELGL